MREEAAPAVLVVDDEESIRKMLRHCLEGAGYRAVLVSSGEAAVACARAAPPMVALLDLRLGGMDGIALTRALAREAPATAAILMTAYATAGNGVEAADAGAVAYLHKPFTPAEVLEAVRHALDVARQRPR
jgi:CheY-like chemotaxis protein